MNNKRLKLQLSCGLVAVILVVAMLPLTVVAQETKVVIPDVSIGEEESTTVPIAIQNATDAVSGASIKLWFDPAVANVTGITQGDFPGFTPNTFFTADGWVKVVVEVGANPSLTGDNIIVANVTLKAVGVEGVSCPLELDVEYVLNDSFAPIPFTPVNGTFTIRETTPPMIEFVEPPTPENNSTNTTGNVTITVTVSDSSGVSTVLLNWNGDNESMNPQSPGTQTMYMTGDATWSINKMELSPGNYTYKVYANDTYDNWGESETRVVTVSAGAGLKGDVNDDGFVNVGDVTYLARYLAEWPGYATTTEAADVNDDGFVNVGDVTYLARYLAEWPGYIL